MPVICTANAFLPIPDRGFDWLATIEGDEPDDNGNWGGPYGHGTTEKEARDNLIAAIFEDVESDHLLALVEALKAKAQEDWSSRMESVHDERREADMQTGYDRAINELMRLLDLPTVKKEAAA